MLLSLTILTLLVQSPAPAQTPLQVWSRALAAVEHDSVPVLRAEWERRLAANQGDRAAQFGLAALDRATYDYASALKRLDQLTGDDAWALWGEWERAYGDVWHAPFDTSYTRFLAVAARARRQNDSTLASAALAFAGFLGSRLGVLGEALDTLDAAMALVPQQQPMLRGRILCTRGPILSFAGRPGAMATVKQGLELARANRDLPAMGLCYHAVAMVAINDVDDATITEVYTDSAIAVQAAAGDGPMQALSYYTKGYSRYSYSDFAGAKKAFADAIIWAERTHNDFVMAWARRIQSQLYWTAGDIPASTQDFAVAESLFISLHDGFGIGNSQAGRGIVLLTMGRVAAAESLFRMQLAITERNGMAEGVFGTLQNLATVRASRGDYRGAMAEIDRAIAYGNANGHAGWTPSLDYRRGVLALRMGDLDAAERYLRGIQSRTSPEQFLDRYAVQTRLAEVAARRGQLDGAIAGLQAAARQLDSARQSLTDAQLRLLIFQTRSATDEPDLGLAPIVSLLVAGDRAPAAFLLAEQRRARTLDEQIIRSALLRGDSIPPHTIASTPDDLAAIRRQLPESLAVITWLAGRGRASTTAWIVTRDTVRGVALPSVDSIAHDIDRYSAMLQEEESTGALEQRLAQAVITPVVAMLPRGITRLILIPDDRLHRVPFDALPLADGEPLLAHYGVSRAPSVAVALRLAARPAHDGPATLVALGDPRTVEKDTSAALDPATERFRRAFLEAGGLPPLTGSRDEARAAGRFSPHAMVRLGDQASESFLKSDSLRAFRVIHVASHALVDDQSESRTSMALAPGHGEDGFLGASEIATLTLDADLVVLSACRTAAGTVIGGEGVQGLVAPLLGAGARTIVASLWPVGDRRTAVLMNDFYQNLADGRSVGEALRSAKLAARARGEPARVWAAFTLVGDPDVRIRLERQPREIPYAGIIAVAVILVLLYRLRARAA